MKFNKKNGEAPHALSQKDSRANGIDISGQKCRQFNEQDLLNDAIIYAMDDANYANISRFSGKNGKPNKVKLILDELHPGKDKEEPYPLE